MLRRTPFFPLAIPAILLNAEGQIITANAAAESLHPPDQKASFDDWYLHVTGDTPPSLAPIHQIGDPFHWTIFTARGAQPSLRHFLCLREEPPSVHLLLLTWQEASHAGCTHAMHQLSHLLKTPLHALWGHLTRAERHLEPTFAATYLEPMKAALGDLQTAVQDWLKGDSPTPTEPTTTALEPISLDTIRQKIGLSPTLLAPILNKFMATADEQLTTITQEYRRGQIQEVTKAIHRLKGAAGSLHFNGFYKALIQLEQTLRQEKPQNAETLIVALQQYWARQKQCLTEQLTGGS